MYADLCFLYLNISHAIFYVKLGKLTSKNYILKDYVEKFVSIKRFLTLFYNILREKIVRSINCAFMHISKEKFTIEH